jgi:hypothetical protein
MAIPSILLLIGAFSPIWYIVRRENLAILTETCVACFEMRTIFYAADIRLSQIVFM